MESEQFQSGFLPGSAEPEPDNKQPQQSFLSFSVLPGFRCFFKDLVIKQNLSFHECYEKVMKDHYTLQKMRLPTEKLFKMTDIPMSIRSKQLYFRSSPKERFYIKSGNEPIYIYNFGKEKQEQISQLQRQLELYRRSSQEALAKKKSQLKEQRQQQQGIRQREEEQKERRKFVLEKLKGQTKEGHSRDHI